ncbi:sialate O-acetylesterase [Methylobacterium isbiliense]|jgi:hypothetical protein|uniref:Sialate O-acetylesterase domain-containing protein n=1 Tax=Methylobacterium isbiliense TaxID=315478 RepID=A0ABQ4SBG4_9HYPH|nr:sialate O-acetylesterase [Methylobacterium isbiliense]MDN3622615.1 sialate O-acetylesterase [Methylobacterium isbiliense]GJE00537.1 hypothetical protein GMJLKIPL_2460 [Methylobacterium isbiliense]
MADGIRSTNLELNNSNLREVLGHVDLGGGVMVLRRQPIEVFVAYLAGLAGVDPNFVAELAAQITQETTDRQAADAAELARAQLAEAILARTQSRTALGLLSQLDVSTKGPVPTAFAIDEARARSIVIPDAASTIALYPILGQSLAVGATTGAVISTTTAYPGRQLMPAGGLHTYGSLSDLIDMREGVDIVEYETIASGFASHLIRDLDAAIPNNNFRIASFISALGGRSYYQLTEGSEQFTFAMRSIHQAYQQQRLKGSRLVVPGVLWIQGENDVSAGWGDHYDLMLHQLQQRLQARIQAITGQTEPVILYVSQTNHINPWDATVYQRLQEAQIRAAACNPLICLVGPTYSFAVNSADHIHKTSRGAYEMGQMFARAVFMRQYGSARSPALTPIDVWRATPPNGVAARLCATFRVPVEPLVLDTSGNVIAVSGAAAAPNGTGGGYGFWVYDDLGNVVPISSVSVAVPSTQFLGAPRLNIDLAVAPTSRYLRVNYAQRRDNDNADTNDGPLTGARGCVRDSAAHVSIVGGGQQHNWSVQFSRLIAA